MGNWVNNGIVSIPSSHSFGSQGDILEELASLLRVGKGSDGRYHAADMFRAVVLNEAAKFKPFNDTAHNYPNDAARLAARKQASYGSPITFAVDSKNSDLYKSTREVFDAPLNARPCRIHDFDGYNAKTKNAMALTTTSATIASQVPLELNDEDGYNISYKDLDVMWTGLWDTYGEITHLGFALYDGDSFPITSVMYGKDEFLSLVYGSGTGQVLDMRQTASNRPVGKNLLLGVVARGSSGKVYMFPDTISIRDTRVPSYNIPFRVGQWTPNMSVGTLTSGQKRLGSVMTGFMQTENQIWFGSNDLLLFGFNVTNTTSVVQYLNNIRVKVSLNEADYFYTKLCVWNNNNLAYPISANATIGPTLYSEFPLFYIDLSGFYQLFKPAANSLMNVSFQLVWVVNFAGQQTTPLTSEARFPLYYKGGAVSDPITPNPSLKPVPPSWDVEIIS